MKLRLPKINPYCILIGFLIASCSDTGENPIQQEPEEDPKEQKAAPTVQTMEVEEITKSSLHLKGQIASNGGSAITKRGFCYNLTGDPTEEDHYAEASSVKGSGEFSSILNDLEPSTTYFVKAMAVNGEGTAYGEEIEVETLAAQDLGEAKVYLDSTTFDNETVFEAHWNKLYPWGSDHNGSARMYDEQIFLEENGVLMLKAERIQHDEGKSGADPWLPIDYHSGAVHFKEHIMVTEEYPVWEISGDFMAPTAPGTWPAFWITGAWSWPPEVDILEYKGNPTNWQNTVTGPDWQNTSWQTKKVDVPSANRKWHNYKVVLRKTSQWDVAVEFFIDGEMTAAHTADYVGKPFWLIINLQMEGSSGGPGTGPDETEYRAKNVYLAAYPNSIIR